MGKKVGGALNKRERTEEIDNSGENCQQILEDEKQTEK